jgi:8-oxo-dGTP pyrophosphatase MutT (NUDIX family)
MNILLQIALKVRRFYWWLIRPVTRGARAIVVNKNGEVLLVRHRYDGGWFLPGGKAHKNESNEDALRRELKEELGVTFGEKEKFGEYLNTYEHKKDTITVFVIQSFTLKEKNYFEIESWQFFDPRALPDGTSSGTQRRIKEWLHQTTINDWW